MRASGKITASQPVSMLEFDFLNFSFWQSSSTGESVVMLLWLRGWGGAFF